MATSPLADETSTGEVPVDSVIREADSVIDAIEAVVLDHLPPAHRRDVGTEMGPILEEILPDMFDLMRDGGHLTSQHRATIGRSARRLRGRGVPLPDVTRAVLAVLPHFGRLITVEGRVLDATTCLKMLARFGLIVGESVDAFTRGYSHRGVRRNLSPRECDILDLVAEGCSDAQVARRLNLSARTVSNYLYRLYPRLGVRSRAGAARWWLTAPGGPP